MSGVISFISQSYGGSPGQFSLYIRTNVAKNYIHPFIYSFLLYTCTHTQPWSEVSSKDAIMTASHDYSRFLSVLLADQIIVIGNKIST